MSVPCIYGGECTGCLMCQEEEYECPECGERLYHSDTECPECGWYPDPTPINWDKDLEEL